MSVIFCASARVSAARRNQYAGVLSAMPAIRDVLAV
jgi:hypothetical protein